MTLKSKKLEEQVAKRSKYSDGVGYKGAKLSSVKKVFMIGLVPKVQENYENVKKILTTIDLSGLPISFSCDIKLDLYLVGKQNASCAHPCIYCSGASPWTNKNSGHLLTIGDLKKFHSDYMKSERKAKDAQEANNCVNENILQFLFSDDTLLLDCLNIQELHIMMGIVWKLLEYIKSLFGKNVEDKERGAAFIHQFLVSLNITLKRPTGLEGNQAEKVAQNSAKLMILADELPQELSVKVKAVAPVLEAFNRVKHSCFGERIQGDYVTDIAQFSKLFRSLPKISIPPKVHLVEEHVVQFLARRRADGFMDHGLAFWGEQAYESSHHDFKQYWERRKLGEDHQNYVEALRDAFLEWNSSHI